MAPVTSSFVAGIIDSLFADLETNLGTDSTVYPAPEYMWLKTIQRAGGMAQLAPNERDCPALWIEYLAGGDKQMGLGRAHHLMQEDFNLYALMVMTPESVGMLDNDPNTFRGIAESSVDTMMRRIGKVVDEWSGTVTDTLLGGTTNGAKMTTWAFVLTAQNELLLEGRVMMHLEVQVE